MPHTTRTASARLSCDDAARRPSPSSRPTLVGRAAAVAGSTAAAAVLALRPAAPPADPTGPVAAPATSPAPPAPAVTAPVVSRPVVPVAASRAAAPAARRASATQKALGKVGAQYRYGAAGPNAFDCSGLVTWAFRGSGTSLPRTSKALSRSGTPVSKGALQAGDLVFFYGGPSHVGIYVGNGKIVHASNRKSPVKVSDMSRMPFHSARRV